MRESIKKGGRRGGARRRSGKKKKRERTRRKKRKKTMKRKRGKLNLCVSLPPTKDRKKDDFQVVSSPLQ